MIAEHSDASRFCRTPWLADGTARQGGSLETTMLWRFPVAYHNDYRLKYVSRNCHAVARAICELLLAAIGLIFPPPCLGSSKAGKICYGATG